MAMISPANTNPGLTKQQYSQQYGFDFTKLHPSGSPEAYFRIPTTDDVQGAVDAQLALQAGFKKAFVVDDSEPYGKGLADFFTANFKSGGGAIAGRDATSATTTAQDPALVTKIKATSPDLVFFGGVTATGGPNLKTAMTTGGLNVPMYGGDGIAQDPQYISIAGNAAAEGTVATVAAPEIAGLTSSAASAFSSSFKTKFNTDPIAYSVNAFDAANIEVAAIAMP
jgi:branched-chain amino acid transport system substrate-binding protein